MTYTGAPVLVTLDAARHKQPQRSTSTQFNSGVPIGSASYWYGFSGGVTKWLDAYGNVRTGSTSGVNANAWWLDAPPAYPSIGNVVRGIDYPRSGAGGAMNKDSAVMDYDWCCGWQWGKASAIDGLSRDACRATIRGVAGVQSLTVIAVDDETTLGPVSSARLLGGKARFRSGTVVADFSVGSNLDAAFDAAVAYIDANF